MQKELNKILAMVNLSSLNSNVIVEQTDVVPSITIAKPDDGAFTLNNLSPHNIFSHLSNEQFVVLRYGIEKELVKRLVDSIFEAELFSDKLIHSIEKSLRSLSHNLRLTQKVSLEMPGQSGEFSRQRENGDFEIRVNCKLLL